jgi:hypothetical protein
MVEAFVAAARRFVQFVENSEALGSEAHHASGRFVSLTVPSRSGIRTISQLSSQA